MGERDGGPRLLAFLLADSVYRDGASGKHIVAGTFNQLESPSFPVRFTGPVTLFASVLGVERATTLELRFLELATGQDLLEPRAIEVDPMDAGLAIEFSVRPPPLPLPRPGRYAFRLSSPAGPLGEAPLEVVERIGG